MNSIMKNVFFLCLTISIGLLLGGCSNTGESRASTVSQGTSPGVAGTGGGGGGGGGFPTKTQP